MMDRKGNCVTSAFGEEWRRILKIIQHFDRNCSCHLQGECVVAGLPKSPKSLLKSSTPNLIVCVFVFYASIFLPKLKNESKLFQKYFFVIYLPHHIFSLLQFPSEKDGKLIQTKYGAYQTHVRNFSWFMLNLFPHKKRHYLKM
jgi:hypothetical protein